MANNSPVLALLARILMALGGSKPVRPGASCVSNSFKPARAATKFLRQDIKPGNQRPFAVQKIGVDLRGRGAAALKASLLESLKPMLAKSEIRAIN